MADNADKKLRRARDRFGAMKTQVALREAVLETPGVTVFDRERIIAQLGKHLDSFKLIEDRNECRADMVAWVVRQAQLTAMFRTILPDLVISGNAASLTLIRLPSYIGSVDDADAFKAWALDTGRREDRNLAALAGLVVEHRTAVRASIRNVLAGCVGLGLDSTTPAERDGQPTCLRADGPWASTVDEIESDVWLEVAGNIQETTGSTNPAASLAAKAKWHARSWKTDRLRERSELSDQFSIGINGIESTVMDEQGVVRRLGVVADEVIDPLAIRNDLIIAEQPWTDVELRWELRRTGPFRSDDIYRVEPLTLAA